MNIETRAIKYGKPTKPAVISILEELYEDAGENERKKLAIVYRHYVAGIKPTKKSKSNFEWVAKAVSKEETRLYLNYVYATGAHIVACDGHRMHWIPDTRAKGFYCPVTEKKLDIDLTFPDWQRVIPSYSAPLTAIVDASAITVKEGHDKLRIVSCELGAQMQAKYFSDAINGEKEGKVQYEGNDQITILNLPHERQAVVMPVRA